MPIKKELNIYLSYMHLELRLKQQVLRLTVCNIHYIYITNMIPYTLTLLPYDI